MRSNTFTLNTEPVTLRYDAEAAAALRQTSRHRYGTHREQVDHDLNERGAGARIGPG